MKSRINTDAREISIKELWWYIISKWKGLVIGFVIGAVLIGGFQYYSDYKDSKSVQAKLDKTSEELLEKFTEKEQQQIELAVDLYERYIEEYDSIDFNYVMSLDSNKVDRVFIQYMIDTNYIIDYNGTTTENYTSDVLKMYVSVVRTQEFREAVMNLGIDNLEEKDIDFLVSASYSGNILEFNIFGQEDDCVRIAEVVKETIEDSFDLITDGVGEHEIKLLNENSTQVYATTIKNAQSTKRSDLKTIQDTSTALINKMSDKQKAAYETLIYQIDYERSNQELTNPSFSVKASVMGGIVGLIIMSVALAWVFLSSKKLRSINDIEQMYNVCLLGKIQEQDSRKISNTLIKKRCDIFNAGNTNEQIKYVVNAIVNKCKNENVESLYVAYDTTINKEIIEAVNKQFETSAMKINSGVPVTVSTDALNSAVDSKNIIFVEKLDSSEKRMITEEIEICDKLDINIVGMVITI